MPDVWEIAGLLLGKLTEDYALPKIPIPIDERLKKLGIGAILYLWLAGKLPIPDNYKKLVEKMGLIMLVNGLYTYVSGIVAGIAPKSITAPTAPAALAPPMPTVTVTTPTVKSFVS
jgi:hypothetical protein